MILLLLLFETRQTRYEEQVPSKPDKRGTRNKYRQNQTNAVRGTSTTS